MIVRARPKYILNFNIDNTARSEEVNDFYFSSGRSALKFYLLYLSAQLGKKLSVVTQAFNCSVVSDAVLESGCKLYLVDISLDDFSLTLKSLNTIHKKIDVVILTHYQGIPNKNYFAIADFCKKNDLFLVEDVAQSYGSMIKGVTVGSLGNAAIFSYAFDKPFTSLYGGKLSITDNKKLDLNFLKKQYASLEKEPTAESRLHIKTLKFLYEFTSDKYYHSGINHVPFCMMMIRFHVPDKCVSLLSRSLRFLFVRRIISRLISTSNEKDKIRIKRLNPVKISFIKQQELVFSYDTKPVKFIEFLCDKYDLPIVQISGAAICWNRYSVLDKAGKLKEELQAKGVEVGNFNWDSTLDKMYENNKNVVISESLVNSHYASQYIVNIPVWRGIGDKFV